MGNKKRVHEMADLAAGVFFGSGWTWMTGENEHIPDHEEIARAIRTLRKEALSGTITSVESGRILVRRDDIDDAIVDVYLNIGTLY